MILLFNDARGSSKTGQRIFRIYGLFDVFIKTVGCRYGREEFYFNTFNKDHNRQNIVKRTKNFDQQILSILF